MEYQNISQTYTLTANLLKCTVMLQERFWKNITDYSPRIEVHTTARAGAQLGVMMTEGHLKGGGG